MVAMEEGAAAVIASVAVVAVAAAVVVVTVVVVVQVKGFFVVPAEGLGHRGAPECPAFPQ